MKSTDIIQPQAISQPIANEGTRFNIPEAATGSELASIATGFPDITMKSLKDGGRPPHGQDFNGMIYLSTDQRVFLQNGGGITFNQDVSDLIGGYAKGSILTYITDNNTLGFAVSQIDDNTYNFNTDTSYLDDNSKWKLLSFDRLQEYINCLYEGRDLSVVLADEIAEAGNLYTVLHNRCQNNDYSGINLLDYFDITMAGGTVGEYTVPAHTAKMRIYGFDTYYNMGDTAIPHHIDFINDYSIGVNVQWNKGNTNNGTSSVQNPWLSSIPYAVCNGVNNASTSAQGSLSHGMNCSSGGILQMLPTSLQNVIITKRMWGDLRYSNSAQLSNASGYSWLDYGKIWIPHETEVNGWQVNSYQRGSLSSTITTYDNLQRNLSVMYPGFRYRSRMCYDPVTKGRVSYWECCPSGCDPTVVCSVYGSGAAGQDNAAGTYISVRFGFRIA